jgi:IclR family transcriptional regulator, pca regulon regulatory protein
MQEMRTQRTAADRPPSTPDLGAAAEELRVLTSAATEGSSGDGSIRRSGEFVQSLERGLAVILAFNGEHSKMTLSEVAARTGLTRAVVRRFLITLVELGYVRVDGRVFYLGPKILELGFSYLTGMSLPEVVQPHLEELSSEVQQTVSLAVLDGTEIVHIVRVPAKRLMAFSLTIGSRVPAFATSLGRVLLASRSDEENEEYFRTAEFTPLTARTVTDVDELRRLVRQARDDGYSIVDQELADGLVAVAVPLHDPLDGIVAALNISTYAPNVTNEVLSVFLPRIKATAAAIEAELRVQGSQGRRQPTGGVARE